MSTVEYCLTLVGGIGGALLLADLPWFRHRALADRLRPYSRHARPGTPPATGPGASLRQVLGPILADGGSRLSRLFGVDTDLGTRLERAGSAEDVVTFRMRQLTAAVVGLAAAGAFALWSTPSPAMSVLLVIGVPVLGALGFEHRLSTAAADRQRRRRTELPVVVEQLGMLLSAGYSLTAAIGRLSERGRGVVASDLTRVMQRVRQGLSDSAALAEWAESSGLDAVRRLVTVLGLHSEAGDMGALISEEAQSERAESHRELIESIERRSQLVWIPVTVATLVPGLIFLAVPFYAAMSQVTGG